MHENSYRALFTEDTTSGASIYIDENEYEDIKKTLINDGIQYCNISDNYFIVRNTCERDINELICPCCRVYSEDAINIVTTN